MSTLRDSQPWVVVGSPDDDALEFETEQVARLFTKQIGTHSSTDMLLAPALTEGDRGLSTPLSSSVPADGFSSSPMTEMHRPIDLSLSLPMLPSSSGRKVSMLTAMESMSTSGSKSEEPSESREMEAVHQPEEWRMERKEEEDEKQHHAVVFDEGRMREAGTVSRRALQDERGAQSASWPGLEAPPDLARGPLSEARRRSTADEAVKSAMIRSLQEKDEALSQWQRRAVEAESCVARMQAESGRREALLQMANLNSFADRRHIQMLQAEYTRLASLLSFRSEPSVRSSFSPPPFAGTAFSRQWDVWQALQQAVTLELPSANAVAAAAAASATMQSGHCSTQDLDALLFMLLGGAAVAAFGFVFFQCTYKLGWIRVQV